MILQGDCIQVMAGMEGESVDAICTDPPYGLGFMAKDWDTVKASHLPPSAEPQDTPLARFRTGKGPAAVAFDGIAFQAWCEAWGRAALRVTKPGGYLLAFGGTRTHHRLVCGLEDAGWIIRDELDWIYASGFPKGKANLKPAHEPIVLARKPGPLRPLAIDACRIDSGERPLIENAGGEELAAAFGSGKYGSRSLGTTTAGRWPSNVLLSDPELFDRPTDYVVGSGAVSTDNGLARQDLIQPNATDGDRVAIGNGPHTAFHYGDTGGYSRFFIIPKASRADREGGLAGLPAFEGADPMAGHRGRRMAGDVKVRPDGKVSAARVNVHPTVKPTALMRHLVKLVTPVGGTVLDCFLGSGSTALAAEAEGFAWIGIEKEAEYVAIAQARLNGVQRGFGI